MNRNVAVVSFGSWPDSFEERINALSQNVESLTIYKPPQRESFRTPDGVDTVHIGPRRSVIWFPLYPIFFVMSILLNDRDTYDAVHSLDFYVGPMCALIYCSIFAQNPKFAMSIRGLPKTITKDYIHSNRLKLVPRKLFRYVLVAYYNIVLTRCDTVIFKSESNKKFFNNITLVDICGKAKIIPTGVNFDAFRPKCRKITNLPEEIGCVLTTGDTIVYAGRIVKGKGVKNLVTYHKQHTGGTRLLVIGDGDDTLVDELIALSSGEENIHIYPERISHEYIPALIENCTAIVLLTTLPTEGAPKIIQESLALGTPAICSDISGIREAFYDIDGCLFVDPESQEDYLDALNTIKNKNADYKSVKERFDLEYNYRKISRLY